MLRHRGDMYHLDAVVNGIRYRESLKTTDWREANRLAKEKIKDATDGKLAQPSQEFARLHFADAIERYRNERVDLQPRSLRTMKERSKPLTAFFGDKPIKRIGVDDLAAYRAKRIKGDGCSPSTFNWELDILRGVLKRAKCWRRFAEEDCARSLKRSPAKVGRALEPKEKERLLSVAKSKPEWETAYLAQTLAFNTTMRGCEIKSLRWADVDLLNREVTIRHSKTAASERTIPLNGEAIAAVMRLRERAKKEFGDLLLSDWYVFPSMKTTVRPVPGPTQPIKGWRTAWRNLTKRAGLAGFRFHDTRHHAITELSEGQNSEQTIMALAGHVSKKMMEHYSHIRKQAKRAAVDALNTRATVPQEEKEVTTHATN